MHEKKLKNIAYTIEKKFHIRVQYTAKMGLAIDEIIKEEAKADLIIMGMRGAGPIREALFGSITTDMMRKTHKPLLIIPQNAEYHGFKHIVFACDFDSKTDLQTLDYLKELVTLFHSKLFVVNVIKRNELLPLHRASTGAKLERKLNDIEHSYSFLENDDLIKEVNDFAHIHDADLITIIPHKHNIIERLFIKTYSKKMAFHTDLPLLALPDPHDKVELHAF